MRLLHIADLHQGLRSHGQPGEGGVSTAVLSAAAGWRYAVDRAIESGCRAILVAGDTFHGPNPEAAELAYFGEGLRRAEAAEVAVLIIDGNHDRAPLPSTPGILSALHRPPHVWAISEPQVVELPAGLRIACLPSIGRHALAAGAPASSRAELEQLVVDSLRRIIAALAAAGAHVLTLHYSIAGALLGAEADISLIPEPMLAPGDLAGPWEFVAAGHIHKRQQLGEQVAYAGSLDRVSFSEERQPKGGWIAEFDGLGELLKVEPWENPLARRFVTLDLEAGVAVGMADPQGAICRIRAAAALAGEAEELRRELLAAGAASCRLELKRARLPARSRQVARTEEPLQALERWLDLQGLSGEDRAGLLALAAELGA